MKAWDGDRSGPQGPEVSVHGSEDVLEAGTDRSPRRVSAGVAVLLVVLAAAAGFLIGSRHRAPSTADPAAPPSAAPTVLAEPLTVTGKRCSVDQKDRLQLGIEIVNRSATTTTLRDGHAILPLKGLRAGAATWGGCGQLVPATAGSNYLLAPRATIWLTIAFDVLIPCPAPLPVLFTVDYDQPGGPGIADLPGFSDLGDVPYASGKCPS